MLEALEDFRLALRGRRRRLLLDRTGLEERSSPLLVDSTSEVLGDLDSGVGQRDGWESFGGQKDATGPFLYWLFCTTRAKS